MLLTVMSTYQVFRYFDDDRSAYCGLTNCLYWCKQRHCKIYSARECSSSSYEYLHCFNINALRLWVGQVFGGILDSATFIAQLRLA